MTLFGSRPPPNNMPDSDDKCPLYTHLLCVQAMGSTWHPECFCCEMCNKELADLGFIKNQGRALCHECNAKVGLDTLSTLTRL